VRRIGDADVAIAEREGAGTDRIGPPGWTGLPMK
jgi:hypothetical protein